MELLDLPIEKVLPAEWNANEMDQDMRARLRGSIQRFGLVIPLVVRPIEDDCYETIGGAQRLAVLRELGVTRVPCAPVDAHDAEAHLLSQALNRIAGADNLGLRAELLGRILKAIPEDQLLALLPETAQSLQALCSLGKEAIAEHLQAWQKAQAAKLKHLQFQFTPAQQEVVEEALERAMAGCIQDDGSPNRRGTALTAICRSYLKSRSDTYTPAYRRRAP